MQSLAVYSMEVSLDSESADIRLTEIDKVLDSWLWKKGESPRVSRRLFGLS